MNKVVILLIALMMFSVVTCTAAGEENQGELTIIAPSEVNEWELFLIRVVSNGTAVVDSIVLFRDHIYHTNSTGYIKARSPRISPGDDTVYNISAEKEGFKSTVAFVAIVNVPQLVLNISSQSERLYVNEEFIVTVYDDTTGAPVYNATVGFYGNNSVEYFTDENGEAVVLPPPSATFNDYYALIATKTGYYDADAIVLQFMPKDEDLLGFGLVLLLGSIVLFIIMKQKYK